MIDAQHSSNATSGPPRGLERRVFTWHCIILAGLTLHAGCAGLDFRSLILKSREKRLEATFEAMNDCDRVELVRRYLPDGRPYDSYLKTTWPSDGAMLRMLNTIGTGTGVSIDLAFNCWSPIHYGIDAAWLSSVEIWRAMFGCDGERVQGTMLLRTCDPLLADVVDSVMNASSMRTMLGCSGQPSVRYLYGEIDFEPQDVVDSVLGLGEHHLVLPQIWGYRYGGTARRTCWGVLPHDSTAEYAAFLDVVSRDIVVMILVRTTDYRGGRGLGVGMPCIGAVFVRRPDDTRLFAVGWYGGRRR